MAKHTNNVVAAILTKPGQPSPKQIRFMLQERGVDLAKVASACGCSESMAYKVISRTRRSPAIAGHIAAALKTTPKRLWGDLYA